jgi:hypothetical protein
MHPPGVALRSPLLLAALLFASLAASCGEEDSTGSSRADAAFCTQAIEAVEGTSDPSDGAQVALALRDVDVRGLEDGDQRAFSGMVSAFESAVEAFNNGSSESGWTTGYVSDLIGRLCGVTPLGLSVVP